MMSSIESFSFKKASVSFQACNSEYELVVPLRYGMSFVIRIQIIYEQHTFYVNKDPHLQIAMLVSAYYYFSSIIHVMYIRF